MLKRIIKQGRYPSCVIAGNHIYLAGHTGGNCSDLTCQLRDCFSSIANTLSTAGAGLADLVHVNLYLVNVDNYPEIVDCVLTECFGNEFPALSVISSEFDSLDCLCMVDGVAYKPE